MVKSSFTGITNLLRNYEMVKFGIIEKTMWSKNGNEIPNKITVNK